MADPPILAQFLAALADDGASVGTLRAARADLRGFVAWWEQATGQPWDPAAVMDRDVRAWCRIRQEDDGLAPATINRGLATLRRFGTWAVEQGLARANPASRVPALPLDPPAPRALPADGVDRLFREAQHTAHVAVQQRDLAILALLGYAGLRSQEACDLQLRDVDLAGGMVTVRRGKAGKGRRVPLHPTAIRLLDAYRRLVRCPGDAPALGSDQEREAFLVGLDTTTAGQPLRLSLTTRQMRRVLAQLGERAAVRMEGEIAREANLARQEELRRLADQLAHVSPHQLRHSVARRLLESGAHLPEVQRVLGHSRLSTTGMYLTPTEEDMRASIARLDDALTKKKS